MLNGAAGAPGWRSDADGRHTSRGDRDAAGDHDGYGDPDSYNGGDVAGPQGDQVDDAYVHALSSAFAEGDVTSNAADDDSDSDAALAPPDAPLGMASAALLGVAQRRMQARQLIREFLRAVPRAEAETTLIFWDADGAERSVTRAQMSAAIDRLRPRQRQIMRLGVEERWPRQRVCAYLRNISIKTFERDQVEALDLLAQL